MDVAFGDINRLMVFLPPRHGKSWLVSQFFPSWYLGMFLDKRVILTAYEADFASTWGRRARDILNEHGPSVFGVEVNNKSSAANRWDLKNHYGGMVTAGVGGPITGKGADILIIDDPVKNAEEANSQTYRNRTWDWYQSTAYTRLEPNGSVILIMTRWHEDDLAGRLLKNMHNVTGEDWEVINLPAIAENNDLLGRKYGEPLWPERYGLNELNRIKVTTGSYWWNSLYQQRPQPPGGGLLKSSWLNYYQHPEIPDLDDLDVYQAWDLAISTKETADFTVCTTVGVTDDNKIYVLDWYRDRIDFPTQVKMVESLAKKWNPLLIGIESNAYQQALPQQLKDSTMLPINEINRTKDKVTRISAGFIHFENGKVFLPENHNELENFINEYVYFPQGKHDDMLDSMELALKLVKEPLYDLDPYLIVGCSNYL
ncbi:phage terminase large subunit [Methanobacterium subterraneum]|uniref:Phage terminase large subunit n=1 Tax=Methanobacterium subterraneum TaxID=59277 RepID=A0A7K4DM90_9EURY|nr:phage terminase large subunit [Methanobacterium subterraneum]NMO09500.1 phage terminase large subunit [Methanobacterium subterraneum]